MHIRRTVQWAIGISATLVLASAAVALAVGATSQPPIERVGSFRSISADLSTPGTGPAHPATGATRPHSVPAAEQEQPTTTAASVNSPTAVPASGPESREHEAQHESRDD